MEKDRNDTNVTPTEQEPDTEERPAEPEQEESSEDSFPASDPPSY